MSLWSRITNVLRPGRLNREIDEEFASHMEEAVADGRDPRESRRAFGSALRKREESRDIRLITRLDSLRADAVFGWRQIAKRKMTSAAAIVSLALAIGACTSAFRLTDAMLLRPLPITDPDRLFALLRQRLGRDGTPTVSDSYEYPLFRQMRSAVKEQAELLAISYGDRTDLTFGSDEEMEKVSRQHVSGWMFPSFGIKPALGRLFTENDDVTPGAHPYAVLSYDYWTSRFGQDPKVIGRTFRMDNSVYEIIGVAGEGFTGTEPGTIVGVFIPTMMHDGVTFSDRSWFRIYVRPKPGVALDSIRDRLRVPFRAFRVEWAKGMTDRPKQFLDGFVNEKLLLEPAAGGISEIQKSYRLALAALGVLVALVLIIACANVANLMTAQAAARAREMALRVSIGAGRWRLVQLVLVESAMLACFAAALGGLFASWSAPVVVGMINPPNNPVRLALPTDWRVVTFGLALALGVTFLFGLVPALRASSVKPASALKGGEDPHSRRRLMHALIAVQVAFCFLVLFVSGLFVTTFQRISNQPTGFSAERLLAIDAVAQRSQPAVVWEQAMEHLRSVPGVESVALAGWPLLSGNGLYGTISVGGGPPNEVSPYFLAVSPGWVNTMKIALVDGREFRASDTPSDVAIVNTAFAKQYFNGENPTGKFFEKLEKPGVRRRLEIVGYVRDARYRNRREPISPTVYLPFLGRAKAAFLVRTAGPNSLALAPILRREVSRARSEFRVSNIRTQQELNESHTVRERLLAMLALFFAAVALVLAGIGLYGVLNYSVLQRQREIGIRMAIGAQPGSIARLVTAEVFSTVLAGAIAGLALGMVSVRYIETLFYQVKATDMTVLLVPAVAILAASILAALPAVVHAVRIDPVQMLRAE